MQPMEIPIPVCPPIPRSLFLSGFSAQSWFHSLARSRLCPPALPIWSASSGHTLTLRSSTNIFVSLLFYQVQLVIPHTISQTHDSSLLPPVAHLSVLPFPRLFTLWFLIQTYSPTPPSSSSATFYSLFQLTISWSTQLWMSPLFIGVSWSRSTPLPLHAWVLLSLFFRQVVFSLCCLDPAQGSLRMQQKRPLFTVPRTGPGSFYSCNIRNVSLSPEQGTCSLHGQQLRQGF